MSGKTRGVNKKERWKQDGPCSVIKLNLDVSGSFKTQTRVQNLFSAMFNLRRTFKGARSASFACAALNKKIP